MMDQDLIINQGLMTEIISKSTHERTDYTLDNDQKEILYGLPEQQEENYNLSYRHMNVKHLQER